ncbi:MAG: methionyl-tRNA formyltransferase, partial [Dysgonamonadaceae bacterium]|nr:methionyl-tRNA formyltransferase [Dysgonamonadaceae bacterium]
RGAAPINWAIINGEKETGITTFFLTHEIDTGKIIFQEKTAISEDDNAESLHDRLMLMGASLVQKTVDTIIDGTVGSVSQSEFYENESDLKPAPKIFKETCRIDWNKSAREVRNFVHGLSPYPAAWTELADDGNIHIFKLFSCETIEENTQKLPIGTVKTDNKTFLHVAVKNGFVNVTDIQTSGKKRMKISDFLNGYKFGENVRFS